MKKITLFILPILFVFIGASCVVSEDAPSLNTQTSAVNTALSVTKNTHTINSGDDKQYTSPSLGVTFQYPERWEIIHETEDAVTLRFTENEVIKEGTSAKDPNGIFFTINVMKPGAYDYDLSLQRTTGMYLTSEQQRKQDEEYQTSSFPQPTLAAARVVTIDAKQGYQYSVQVQPNPKDLPLTELSNYYDSVEYYIPVNNANVAVIKSTVGYGKNHDALVATVATVVDTIKLQ